jgi:hypothetical protein
MDFNEIVLKEIINNKFTNRNKALNGMNPDDIAQLDVLVKKEKIELNKEKDVFKKVCDGFDHLPTIVEDADRIIAIGDLHGDFKLTKKILRKSKVIDKNNNWIGGNTVVVQVGDQIDRCRPMDGKCHHDGETYNDEASDIAILEYMTNLHTKAKKLGGAVYSLLGNHELMNVKGNMNYVSRRGLEQFDNYKDPKTKEVIVNGLDGRKHAFRPGNEYASYLGCTRLSAIIVKNCLFAHAGILPNTDVKDSIDLIHLNAKMRRWLLGKAEDPDIKAFVYGNKQSVFWTRIFGKIPANESMDNPTCTKYLAPVLSVFRVGNMIIGHTPQIEKGINASCDNALWRVDFAGSQAFQKFDQRFKKDGNIQETREAKALEIVNGKIFSILN